MNVWSVVCDGSIDRKLEAGIHEKKDAAELVLDGHLLGETPVEVNLHELLRLAQAEFKSVKTIDEDELKKGWPRLRAALGRAFLDWKGKFRIEVDRSQKSVTVAMNGRLPSNVKTSLSWRQLFLRRKSTSQ